MFSILLYAVASFYYILSNLPTVANSALSFAKSVPLIQAQPALLQLEKKIQTTILPSASMRAAVSGGLSLLTYPLVMSINEVIQFFVYWLALFGFAYLSLSQHPEVLQNVSVIIGQAVQVLKAAAPDQFKNFLALTDKSQVVKEQ